MKILFCTNAFENVTNGPVRFANIILEINQLYPQHELRILTEDVSDSRLSALKHVHKVYLNIPRLLKPFGQILRWFIYYRHVKQIQKTFDFDVLVYINSFNGLWASLVSNKPTVGMVNDEKNMLATWQNFSLNSLWLKRFAFQQFERLSVQNHRLVIANSDFLKHRLQNTYHLPASKVVRLYKSIPLDGIDFQPHRAFVTPIKVLFVKADYLVGELPTLAKALQRLTQYQFELTVIGPEPWFEARLKSLFVGIQNIALAYLGPQPQERVYACMRTCDIFCVPSYTEAFGVANIEALAHGISVVSSQVGGIPEVLDQGQNGWLVAPSNAEDLAKALEECIENPALRLQKAQNGRKFIERFSKDEMLRNFIETLGKLIENERIDE
jgi:colanic acid/amylovoran biosynthesis glycosyltransferase